MISRILGLIFWVSIGANVASCQDSVRVAKPETVVSVSKKANKAAFLSLLLPGAGQVYNQDYWKVPIIYAAMGTCAYFFVKNHQSYLTYQQAYRYRTDNDSLTVDSYPAATNETLLAQREFYRRNRDLVLVLGVLSYALNSVEAYVAQHLKGFAVTDDLSLRFHPTFLAFQNNAGIGVSCSVSFRNKLSMVIK